MYTHTHICSSPFSATCSFSLTVFVALVCQAGCSHNMLTTSSTSFFCGFDGGFDGDLAVACSVSCGDMCTSPLRVLCVLKRLQSPCSGTL